MKKKNYILGAVIVILLIILFAPKKSESYYLDASVEKVEDSILFSNKKYKVDKEIVKDKKIDESGYSFSDNKDLLIEIKNEGSEELKVALQNKISSSVFFIPRGETKYIFISEGNKNKKSLDFITNSGQIKGQFSIYKLDEVK